MNQVKIGKFIAECRKNKNLTQLQLAEKLNVTDRAVSKWENGKSMPDSSIMLNLCDVFGVTVNDLLHGEIVAMENYEKELEKTLLEMKKQKEESDRQLLKLEWVIGILSILVLLIPVFIGAYVPMENWQKLLIVFSGFIPAFIGFIFAVKIERTAGYYECKECGNKYVPDMKSMLWAQHMGRTRYMRCPKCNKKSWQKKVITK